MENQIIREIALREFKDNNEQRILFVRFMEKRFPNEKFESYIMVWVERFKGGNPIEYMDLYSQKAYNEAKLWYNGWTNFGYFKDLFDYCYLLDL